MKTIRQVKTVFVIFISFVCCWSPYIVVLLYDTSDRLPLPVHLYASMLAHLHASLNFAIYGLNSRTFRAAYRRLATHLVVCCSYRTTTNTIDTAAAGGAGTFGVEDAHRDTGREAECLRGLDVTRTLIDVECQPLHDYTAAELSDGCGQLFSISSEKEHDWQTEITQCK